jgi:chromosome segregation ATPase
VGGDRDEVTALERSVDQARKQIDAEKKKQEDLVRERDVLGKMRSQAESATHQQQSLIKIKEAERRSLDLEIQAYKAAAKKQAQVHQSLTPGACRSWCLQTSAALLSLSGPTL